MSDRVKRLYKDILRGKFDVWGLSLEDISKILRMIEGGRFGGGGGGVRRFLECLLVRGVYENDKNLVQDVLFVVMRLGRVGLMSDFLLGVDGESVRRVGLSSKLVRPLKGMFLDILSRLVSVDSVNNALLESYGGRYTFSLSSELVGMLVQVGAGQVVGQRCERLVRLLVDVLGGGDGGSVWGEYEGGDVGKFFGLGEREGCLVGLVDSLMMSTMFSFFRGGGGGGFVEWFFGGLLRELGLRGVDILFSAFRGLRGWGKDVFLSVLQALSEGEMRGCARESLLGLLGWAWLGLSDSEIGSFNLSSYSLRYYEDLLRGAMDSLLGESGDVGVVLRRWGGLREDGQVVALLYLRAFLVVAEERGLLADEQVVALVWDYMREALCEQGWVDAVEVVRDRGLRERVLAGLRFSVPVEALDSVDKILAVGVEQGRVMFRRASDWIDEFGDYDIIERGCLALGLDIGGAWCGVFLMIFMFILLTWIGWTV